MKKTVFIIHGWGGGPKELLHKLLKKKLTENRFEVIAPKMPNADEPKINEWVNFLNGQVKNLDENTYFIGHSIGCQTIMRYLETLPEKTRVGKCIFIAGWFNLDNLESEKEKRIAKPWIDTPINFDKIKIITKEILVCISSNEFYGCVKENSKIFKEKLGAKVIIEKNMGHFTDEEGEEKISRFVGRLIKEI